MKRLVIVPSKNEGKSIRSTLKQLEGEDVVVCDGGSTDSTKKIARLLGVPVLNCASGYGKVILEGFKYGLPMGYKQFVVIDCESHTFSEIVPFLESGADVIAGLRHGEKKPWYRKAITQFGRKMIPLGASTDIVDISNGFRAYSREFVEYLMTIEGLDKVPSYTFNSIVAFYSNGWKVEQFPMSYIGGKTGLTIKELLKAWFFRVNYKMQIAEKTPAYFDPTEADVVAFLKMQFGDEFVNFCNRRKRD